ARRMPLASAPALASDTVYLTVVDRDRMAVSLINTLFSHFGGGICTQETGIVLTNRGACFVVDPDHPNTFGPDKRPMHTIIPALAFRGGRCELAFGVMGSPYQPMGHTQGRTQILRSAPDRRGGGGRGGGGIRGGGDDGGRARAAARVRRRATGARPRGGAGAFAVGRRAGDPHRLGAGRADRRLRSAQGRLRLGVLGRELIECSIRRA